jgi:hypothetical protein
VFFTILRRQNRLFLVEIQQISDQMLAGILPKLQITPQNVGKLHEHLP